MKFVHLAKEVERGMTIFLVRLILSLAVVMVGGLYIIHWQEVRDRRSLVTLESMGPILVSPKTGRHYIVVPTSGDTIPLR